MKRVCILLLLIAFTMSGMAQETSVPDSPKLTFTLQLKVTIGDAYSVGDGPHGRRTVIPITGGTFEGPNIKGAILEGGADYQLSTPDGRTELEAIYCIKTDDGVIIHVRNRGMSFTGKDADGNPKYYFRTAPQFEAPSNSNYGWLNNSLFVCAPSFSSGFDGIVLNVWRVE